MSSLYLIVFRLRFFFMLLCKRCSTANLTPHFTALLNWETCYGQFQFYIVTHKDIATMNTGRRQVVHKFMKCFS